MFGSYVDNSLSIFLFLLLLLLQSHLGKVVKIPCEMRVSSTISKVPFGISIFICTKIISSQPCHVSVLIGHHVPTIVQLNYPLIYTFNRLFFKSSYRYIAKLNGKCTKFPYTPFPPLSTSPTRHLLQLKNLH